MIKDSDGNTILSGTSTDNKYTGPYRKITISDNQYYQLLQSGKTITITMNQNGNNYTLGGSSFNHITNGTGCNPDEYYYWGNFKIGYVGC